MIEILLSSAAASAATGLASYALARRTRRHPAPCQSCLTDALTGLGNRRLVTDVLTDRLVLRGLPTVVTMVDLDRFKAVNDTYGHEAGDQVLVEVGRRLVEVCGRDDVVARLGGDEFVVVSGALPHTAAAMRAAAIHAAITSPIHHGGQALTVGASLGVVMATPAAARVNPGEVLKAADLAMYQAKTTGCGVVLRTAIEALALAPTEPRPTVRLRDVRDLDPTRWWEVAA